MDPRSSATIGWVTVTRGPQRDRPPAVVPAAGALSMTARRVAPALRRAGEDLQRHVTAPPTASQQATAAARAYADAARSQLRQDWQPRRPAIRAADRSPAGPPPLGPTARRRSASLTGSRLQALGRAAPHAIGVRCSRVLGPTCPAAPRERQAGARWSASIRVSTRTPQPASSTQ